MPSCCPSSSPPFSSLLTSMPKHFFIFFPPAINAREIQLAQAQLDAWSQIVFTTSPAAGLPALPPPLPATFSPPAFDWTAALYPSPTLPPAAIATSSTAPSQGEDTTPSPPAPAGGRRSAKAKGKAKVEAEEKYKGSDEEEEGGEEDKRKRNTAGTSSPARSYHTVAFAAAEMLTLFLSPLFLPLPFTGPRIFLS